MKDSKSDRHILSRLSRLFRAHRSSHDLSLAHSESLADPAYDSQLKSKENLSDSHKNGAVLAGGDSHPGVYGAGGKALSKSSLDLKSADIRPQLDEMPESLRPKRGKHGKGKFVKHDLTNLKSFAKATRADSDHRENAAIRKYILGIDDELDDIPLGAVNIIRLDGTVPPSLTHTPHTPHTDSLVQSCELSCLTPPPLPPLTTLTTLTTLTNSHSDPSRTVRNGVEVKTVQASVGKKSVTGMKEISYTNESMIGNGSFGVVYKATLVEENEVVAIKRVLQDRRFKNRELSIMVSLEHCNIVRLKYYFYTYKNVSHTGMLLCGNTY